MYKGYEKDIFVDCNKDSNSRTQSRREACISSIPKELYITNGLPLYIIKPQARCTLARDEIQPQRG